MNIDIINKELNKLINKAKKNNEVPIAALIVYNNEIIAKEYNTVEKDNNILSHAEIKAIRSASKKLNNWRLNNCSLYVTLEPCDMCRQIIKKSRIKKVYYYIEQNEFKTENDPSYYKIDDTNNFTNNLKQFFINIRND